MDKPQTPRIDRALALAGFFGYFTLVCGDLATALGSDLSFVTVLWTSLIAAAVAGGTGFWWDRMEDRE